MIQNKILHNIQRFFKENNIPLSNKISLEFSQHADLATNAAMLAAQFTKTKPQLMFKDIKGYIAINGVQSVDFLNGFINITISKAEYVKSLITCLKEKHKYGYITSKDKIHIECGSMNPTGMVHIGHTRIIIFGEALSRLLAFTGYEVTKEYYINDAGRQVNELAESVLARYFDLFQQKHDCKIHYPEPFLIEIAEEIKSKHGEIFLFNDNKDQKNDQNDQKNDQKQHKNHENYIDLHTEICNKVLKNESISSDSRMDFFTSSSIIKIMHEIIQDCKKLNVEYDVFFSEKNMQNQGKIESVVEKLNTSREILTEKHSPKGETTNKALLVFNSPNGAMYPLTKANDEWTYFAADIAYHQAKIDRGFHNIINIWGADHNSHIKRVKSAIDQINDKINIEFIGAQMMSVKQGDENVKISKRSGSMINVRDMLNQINANTLKCCILEKTPDAHFIFDTSIEKIDDLFYINYAYARINSILKKAKIVFNEDFENYNLESIDINAFSDFLDKDYIKPIFQWPEILKQASKSRSPKKICVFLYKTAKIIHNLWTKSDNKILNINDKEKSIAKILLMIAIKNILFTGSKILSLELEDHMG